MNKVERGKRVLKCLALQDGVVFCADQTERAKAKQHLAQMQDVFPDYIAQLDVIYLYRQAEQTAPCWQESDGVETLKTNNAEGRLFRAIGLSVEALHTSPEYFKSLFIHELTHIVVQEHGEKFNNTAKALREAYMMRTGEKLVVDGMENDPKETNQDE